MDHRLTALIEWIRQTALPANGLLVPVSGGSDSALCFWLCCQAFPDKTMGIHVGDQLRCRQWLESIGKVQHLPEANTTGDKEVVRWACFQSICLKERRWLVGSRNRSEEVFGTFSLASRMATYLPLSGVWKSEVMDVCKLIGVPEEIRASSRQADPDCGRPREMSEIPLELIDQFLQVRAGELPEQALSVLNEGQCRYLETVYQANRFKQNLPVRGPRLLQGELSLKS